MGLGKRRTRLGDWMDDRGVKQTWLEGKAKFSRPTVSALCNDVDYRPNITTVRAVLKALREIDPNVSATQFWDL